MKITKLGHSCLLVEELSARFLIDPGKYNSLPADLPPVDAILVSHSHADHCDPEAILRVLTESSQAKIMTNQDVRENLLQAGVSERAFMEGHKFEIAGVGVEAFENDHRIIHPKDSKEIVPNSSFVIADKLYHPGDVLFNPNRNVKVLALPVAGGWLKVGEAIDLAIAMRPEICIPIHDAQIVAGRYGGMHGAPKRVLPLFGIEFMVPGAEPMEFP